MNDITVSGELPNEVLGTSSTKRELTALYMVGQSLKEHLRNKRVLIKMDSFAAVRNLIKGGGAIENLNAEIKKWYNFCTQSNIDCSYEWVKRELNEQADAASKQAAVSYTLFQSVSRLIQDWLKPMQLKVQTKNGESKYQTNIPIHTPVFDKISLRLTSIIQGWGYTVIVVPLWSSQAWWSTLLQHKKVQLNLGHVQQVYEMIVSGRGQNGRWQRF